MAAARIATMLVVTALVGACGVLPTSRTLRLTDTDSSLTVTVTDRSGVVRDARIVSPGPAWPLDGGDGRPLRFHGIDDHTLQMTWDSGKCPTAVRVDIERAGDAGLRVTLDPGPRCQEDVAKIRVVELLLGEPISVDQITGTVLGRE